jgi:hypothetical protein
MVSITEIDLKTISDPDVSANAYPGAKIAAKPSSKLSPDPLSYARAAPNITPNSTHVAKRRSGEVPYFVGD